MIFKMAAGKFLSLYLLFKRLLGRAFLFNVHLSGRRSPFMCWAGAGSSASSPCLGRSGALWVSCAPVWTRTRLFAGVRRHVGVSGIEFPFRMGTRCLVPFIDRMHAAGRVASLFYVLLSPDSLYVEGSGLLPGRCVLLLCPRAVSCHSSGFGVCFGPGLGALWGM